MRCDSSALALRVLRSVAFALLTGSISLLATAHAAVLSPQDAPATIDANSPAFVLSPNHTTVAVPITLTRVDATPILGFSVTLSLSGPIQLSGGTAGIAEGAFLLAGGGTTAFQVVDNGGGSYTIDAVTLGSPCGSPALTGALFTLTLAANGTSGTGSVTVTGVALRDCGNAALPATIGASASASVDFVAPTVTLTAPNGGEFWATQSSHDVMWTATDASGITSVDLAYSTDGGATFPNAIATGIANTGSRAWTIPVLTSSLVRVRVTAHDAQGNVATDDSDANFSIGPWVITASAGPGGTIDPVGAIDVNDGGSQNFTIAANPGFHILDVLVDLVSVGPVTSYLFTGVTANHTIAASFAANPAVDPITGLAAATVRSGNDANGTAKIAVTWPAVPGGQTVAVYRAAFGNYPEYDDAPNAGSVPSPPSYPPPTAWTLTSITASGQTDEPSTRDAYYYVAFVTDQFGTRSLVSNLAGAALNYFLGDVSNGSVDGQGDNAVTIQDVALLGLHYGLTGGAVAAFGYLDVGPTTDFSVLARPTTDNRIDFEDLVMFGIDYGTVSAPQSASRPAAAPGADEARLAVGEDAGILTAQLFLRGTGALQAVSARLDWDATTVEPVGFVPGALLEALGAIAYSPEAGAVDASVLGTAGSGLGGEGELARFTFRRLRAGDTGLRLRAVDARDAGNRRVPVTIQDEANRNPDRTLLFGARPNPSSGPIEIAFSVSRGGPVELVLYGVDGRQVRALMRESQGPGVYRIAWDGRDEAGHTAPPGLYFARLTTPSGRFVRSLARVR